MFDIVGPFPRVAGHHGPGSATDAVVTKDAIIDSFVGTGQDLIKGVNEEFDVWTGRTDTGL